MSSLPIYEKRWSIAVFILELFALAALFQKLSFLPNFLQACIACTSQDPILTYMGIGYFTLLTARSQLFPGFPSQQLARMGLIWAVLLSLTLTAIRFPQWCTACLIAHVCHVLIWSIWSYVPCSRQIPLAHSLSQRLCLVAILPISFVTMTLYPIATKPSSVSTTGLHLGESIPKTYLILNPKSEKSLLINFISNDCPFCKIQLPLITELSENLDSRFIFIAPKVTEELKTRAPNIEWIEDNEGILHEEFKILAHPTLFVVNADGKIAEIISGIPKDLKEICLHANTKHRK